LRCWWNNERRRPVHPRQIAIGRHAAIIELDAWESYDQPTRIADYDIISDAFIGNDGNGRD
jgi:glucose-6-phosphate dehydrogenase assembly protein OpcA